jgi:hypothetical protein
MKATSELYHRVLSSVSGQEMTASQIAEMGSILTSIQMHYLPIPSNTNYIFGLWTILFRNNIHLLTLDKGYTMFSTGDIWASLFRLERVIVPCFDIKVEDSLRTKPDLELDSKFHLNRISMENMTNGMFKSIDFENEPLDQLLEKFENGI